MHVEMHSHRRTYQKNIFIYQTWFRFSCTVDGLPLNEFRILAEKSTTTPEYRDEKNRRVEFATPTFNVLNALEQVKTDDK
jgi:hypothetical protein